MSNHLPVIAAFKPAAEAERLLEQASSLVATLVGIDATSKLADDPDGYLLTLALQQAGELRSRCDCIARQLGQEIFKPAREPSAEMAEYVEAVHCPPFSFQPFFSSEVL